jgi:hypothetical protein
VRNNNDVPDTSKIRAGSGAKAVTNRGIDAPTPKLRADAKAA